MEHIFCLKNITFDQKHIHGTSRLRHQGAETCPHKKGAICSDHRLRNVRSVKCLSWHGQKDAK